MWQRAVVGTFGPELTTRGSDATLVEALVTARLLGMRILRVDATVALMPAEVAIAAPPVAAPPLEQRAALAAARSFSAPPRPAGVLTPRLADAVRNLDEGAKVLAQVRRTGT